MRSSPSCGSCRIAASRDASAREREPRDRRSLRPTAVHARSPRRSSIAVEPTTLLKSTVARTRSHGSSRIGRAAALSVGDHGGKVVITGRRAYCVSQFARSKAPPTPEKTAKFRGALTPNASVIATPNDSRRSPLNSAVARVCQPTRRRRPKRISAPVAMTPSGGIIPAGKYQLSSCVYSKNREKCPHSTFGCQTLPTEPYLSATAERKPSPSAYRKNTELKRPHLRDILSSCLFR